MKTPPLQPWSAYDEESEKYTKAYSKLYFSNIHRKFIEFLPRSPHSKVLDIGCGSGRDALSLARRGYKVTAIDPSTEMLRYAETHNNNSNITWMNDSLPTLEKLKGNKYAFILLSAVWMHTPPHQRKDSLRRISSLLEEGGYAAITLRIGPPDPERVMYTVSTNELLEIARSNSLFPAYRSRPNKDSLKREAVQWEKIVLQRN
ncbi:TPA: class I SAM-dependent methyltransferase [Pseudomonas aeruginosa]|nr:class I SAM-dependent methyltransferase [Pseudomonas aeruginosa]